MGAGPSPEADQFAHHIAMRQRSTAILSAFDGDLNDARIVAYEPYICASLRRARITNGERSARECKFGRIIWKPSRLDRALDLMTIDADNIGAAINDHLGGGDIVVVEARGQNVTRDGRPGVCFFSLDAANAVAVAVARSLFHLPYFRACMRLERRGGEVAYASERTHRGAPSAVFHGRYAPTGPAAPPPPGSLAYFLTARYCLYAADAAGDLYRAEIDHSPWPLQAAEASITVNSTASAAGVSLPDTAPLLHFARRLEVRVWPHRRLPRH